MPTGYTADVADGTITDFRTFALRCARAFGACIMQRDDDMSEPPRVPEPSDFYQRLHRETEIELVRMSSLSTEDVEREYESYYTQAARTAEERRAEDAAKRKRYEAMVAHVEPWCPPSDEHEGLKKFMLEQLHQSIDFDCNMDWSPPPRISVAFWHSQRIAKAKESLIRYSEEVRKERERYEERKRWIEQLYESLGD